MGETTATTSSSSFDDDNIIMNDKLLKGSNEKSNNQTKNRECSKHKIIYVGQGEIGHVSSFTTNEDYNDDESSSDSSSSSSKVGTILVTDRATTCHMIVFRSYSSSNCNDNNYN